MQEGSFGLTCADICDRAHPDHCAIRLSGAAIPPGPKTRYDQIMRVCRLCAGPMPEIVRDDALYCSTSCKLKAQRGRKKESARQTSEDRPRILEPVAPFGNVEQLSFSFMDAAPASSESATEPKTSGPAAIPLAAPAPTKSKPRSWLDEIREKLKGKPDDAKPRQRSRGRGVDIV